MHRPDPWLLRAQSSLEFIFIMRNAKIFIEGSHTLEIRRTTIGKLATSDNRVVILWCANAGAIRETTKARKVVGAEAILCASWIIWRVCNILPWNNWRCNGGRRGNCWCHARAEDAVVGVQWTAELLGKYLSGWKRKDYVSINTLEREPSKVFHCAKSDILL